MRRPASFASASRRCTSSRVTGSWTRSRPIGAPGTRSCERASADGPEHAVRVVVRERSGRIEPGADCLELRPVGIERLEVRSGPEVPLAPVRTAAVLARDRLDAAEVRPPVELAVLVDGDVAGVALVRGA